MLTIKKKNILNENWYIEVWGRGGEKDSSV